MKALVFDWGLKHVGVALVMTEHELVVPLKTLKSSKGLLQQSALDGLLADHRPSEFIVGLPLNMDDTESVETRKAREFGENLTHQYGLPVNYIDERLSTREAIYRSNQPRPDHSLAAVVIGESWLNQQSQKI